MRKEREMRKAGGESAETDGFQPRSFSAFSQRKWGWNGANGKAQVTLAAARRDLEHTQAGRSLILEVL